MAMHASLDVSVETQREGERGRERSTVRVYASSNLVVRGMQETLHLSERM